MYGNKHKIMLEFSRFGIQLELRSPDRDIILYLNQVISEALYGFKELMST